MCEAHYYRVRRTGSVGVEPIKPHDGGTCSVTGCESPSDSRGMCQKHYTRWTRHGDPEVYIAHGNRNFPAAENHHFWKGESAGYVAAHERVRALKGKASDWLCVDCGAQGAHWSYTKDDPDEKIGTVEGKRLSYSLDPDRYVPRCVTCHKRFDRKPTQSCSIEGCELRYYGRSFCAPHYRRHKRAGTLPGETKKRGRKT